MSDTQHEDLFNDESQTPPGNQGPAQLREALDKRKAENDELRKQVAELREFKRETSVKQFVTNKGLPEKAIGLIGDTDPEKWYEEFGDLFTPAGNEGPAEQGAETATPGASTLSADQQEQISAVTGVQALPYDPKSLASRDAYLDAATSEDDYLKRAAEVGLLAQ